MSFRSTPHCASAALTTGYSISDAVWCSSAATIGACAKPTIATFLSWLTRTSESGLEPVDEALERRVGLAGRAEVLDVGVVTLALAVGLPDGLDARPHAHVGRLALLDEAVDRERRAVERDRRDDVRELEVAPVNRDVHDAEGRDDASVGQLDDLLARREALGRVHERRHEDLARLAALRAEDLLVLERAQVERPVVAGVVVVRQVQVRLDVLDALLRRFVHRWVSSIVSAARRCSPRGAAPRADWCGSAPARRQPTRSKRRMSLIVPVRWASGAHTALTRLPTSMRSRSRVAMWASAVSAASSFTSRKAKGWSLG